LCVGGTSIAQAHSARLRVADALLPAATAPPRKWLFSSDLRVPFK
jgi:hypothetical protein